MSYKDYYSILDLAIDADESSIRKSFRKLAIKYHPDKNSSDPYFTAKFIEVKEAYDILINRESRQQYDEIHRQKIAFDKKDLHDYKKARASGKTKEKEFEEKFHYEPHKPYFSHLDRLQERTPQVRPIFDLLGNKLAANVEFFKYPTRIGKILYAHSDLTSDSWINNPGQKKSLWEKMFGISSKKVTHVNYYVGINGFALYECRNKKDNITASYEVNFDDVTDLFKRFQDNSQNFVYQWTDFSYMWINRSENFVKWGYTGEYNKKAKVQNHHQLNFCVAVERAWNIYLLDAMENELQSNGYLSFAVYDPDKKAFKEFIQMGVGYLKIFDKETTSTDFRFDQIDSIKFESDNLVIQHKNFTRKAVFFTSGDKSKIPLIFLTNRDYFFKALQLLLGFKEI